MQLEPLHALGCAPRSGSRGRRRSTARPRSAGAGPRGRARRAWPGRSSAAPGASSSSNFVVLVQRAVGPIRRPLARVQQRVHHHVRDPRCPPSRRARTGPAPWCAAWPGTRPTPWSAASTFTPTALRFDWITVDIATGDCMPEPDSGTHSVVEKPFGKPGLGQELLRPLGIVGIGLEAGIGAPRAGQHRARARASRCP